MNREGESVCIEKQQSVPRVFCDDSCSARASLVVHRCILYTRTSESEREE